jgi:hypothetical protein
VHITAEVCRGLAYAHGRKTPDGRPLGIVHRDVSPQNVLISEHGEVKLTDFGIAKAMITRENTQNGTIKGKVDFMSPEQAAGGAIDAASDIFSLGAMLYLLATGERPYAAASPLDSLFKAKAADYLPPERVNPTLVPGLVTIIKRAMHPVPAERYHSAEDMMIALEEILRSEFRSVGQNTLRRWLTQLGERDQVPPISRIAALPSEASRASESDDGWAELNLEAPSEVTAMEHVRLRTEDLQALSGREPRQGSWGTVAWVALGLIAAAAVVAQLLPRGVREDVRGRMNALLHGTGAAGAGEGAAGAGAAGKDRARASAEPTRAAAAAPRGTVMIKLITRPAGAAVSGPQGPLGTTPLVVEMSAQSSGAFTFTKAGFGAVTRQVTADPARPTVVIELGRKKTRPKR